MSFLGPSIPIRPFFPEASTWLPTGVSSFHATRPTPSVTAHEGPPAAKQPPAPALNPLGVALTFGIAAFSLFVIPYLLIRRDKTNAGQNGHQPQRLDDFPEFKQFIEAASHEIITKSFEGYPTPNQYLHVMATRGGGITMSSTAVSTLGPFEILDPHEVDLRKSPRSSSAVKGYRVYLKLGPAETTEILPTSDKSKIEALHVGVVEIYRATLSYHRGMAWFRSACDAIMNGTDLPAATP